MVVISNSRYFNNSCCSISRTDAFSGISFKFQVARLPIVIGTVGQAGFKWENGCGLLQTYPCFLPLPLKHVPGSCRGQLLLEENNGIPDFATG